MNKLLILIILLLSTNCYASDILLYARAEIGKGETIANNRGEVIKLYNRGFEGAWCAGFVSYILDKAGFKDLGYSLSAKQIYNRAKALNLITDKARAGDLIVFWRESKKSWKAHIGIVEKIEGNYIHTIEGNVGDYPSVVKRIKYNKNNIPKLLGFIKINRAIE